MRCWSRRLVLFGIALVFAAPLRADQYETMRNLREVLTVCQQLDGPSNTMARLPGYDGEAASTGLETRWRLAAERMASAEGLAAIDAFLVANPDGGDVFCMVRTAALTRAADARPILRRYVGHADSRIADAATRGLAASR